MGESVTWGEAGCAIPDAGVTPGGDGTALARGPAQPASSAAPASRRMSVKKSMRKRMRGNRHPTPGIEEETRRRKARRSEEVRSRGKRSVASKGPR